MKWLMFVVVLLVGCGSAGEFDTQGKTTDPGLQVAHDAADAASDSLPDVEEAFDATIEEDATDETPDATPEVMDARGEAPKLCEPTPADLSCSSSVPAKCGRVSDKCGGFIECGACQQRREQGAPVTTCQAGACVATTGCAYQGTVQACPWGLYGPSCGVNPSATLGRSCTWYAPGQWCCQ